MPNLSINLIKNLYYKDKLSTVEIAKKLKVSPWVVLKFMKRRNLSRRTFKESNAIKFDRKPVSFSVRQKLSEEERKLKIVGAMLYWTEGSKPNPKNRSWTVDFVNSNPRMIKLFLEFLRKICGVDERRLRILLYCYADQNIGALKKYWYKATKIPLAQFTKPYIRKDFLPEKSGKMKYGLVHVRYSDKKLLLQIENWIKEYLKKNNI